MGMFSEIAVEGIIQKVCVALEKGLTKTTNPEAIECLKTLGREALTWFEWDTPDWAGKYKKLFKDK